jgi:hypothetical protein
MQKSPLVFTGEDSQLEKPKFGLAKTRFDVKGTIRELNPKTKVGEHDRFRYWWTTSASSPFGLDDGRRTSEPSGAFLVFREGAENRTRGPSSVAALRRVDACAPHLNSLIPES